jgi:hypothetical protein
MLSWRSVLRPRGALLLTWSGLINQTSNLAAVSWMVRSHRDPKDARALDADHVDISLFKPPGHRDQTVAERLESLGLELVHHAVTVRTYRDDRGFLMNVDAGYDPENVLLHAPTS